MHHGMEKRVRIALIIPTIGRPKDLRACLDSIARDDSPTLAQVIVFDDASPVPVTVPPRLDDVPVRLLRNHERRGAAYCRNAAMDALADEVDVVGFVDDDARLCPGWLAIASRELVPGRGAITGPIRRFDRGLVSHARQLRYDRRYAPLTPGQAVDFLAGGNALVWRDALVRAGGFPDVKTMSDRLLVRRLEAHGLRCHFVPDLYVLHRNSKGVRVAVREAWRAGLIDDTPQAVTALARLAAGAREALAHRHPIAALFNVALDGVYLGGRAASRSRARRADPSLSIVPPKVKP